MVRGRGEGKGTGQFLLKKPYLGQIRLFCSEKPYLGQIGFLKPIPSPKPNQMGGCGGGERGGGRARASFCSKKPYLGQIGFFCSEKPYLGQIGLLKPIPSPKPNQEGWGGAGEGRGTGQKLARPLPLPPLSPPPHPPSPSGGVWGLELASKTLSGPDRVFQSKKTLSGPDRVFLSKKKLAESLPLPALSPTPPGWVWGLEFGFAFWSLG